MLNLIAAGATYLFPGGRALKLVKDGINVTNSTNPLILTKNIIPTRKKQNGSFSRLAYI